MDITELIKCLQTVAKKHPNAIIYFGHKDGSGTDDDLYLVGEYSDENLVNHRCCCIGEQCCDYDKMEVVDFDEIFS